jgi:hypothetical protein
MRVVFLDFDGVLNSAQSAGFWHSRRDQAQWENNMYRDWAGTLKEYIAMEFCPIALSNVEELMRRVPDLKIVVSSSWRVGETIESLQKILSPSKLICERIIGVTESFSKTRGDEIEKWLTEHPEVIDYVILDDDRDMLYSQRNNFINTSPLHGFLYGDMLQALRILGEGGTRG